MRGEMARRSKPAPIEVWGWMQLRAWTVATDRKLFVIMMALKQLLDAGGQVSPELEAALNELEGAVQAVDEKVADKPIE
jgi:hypothetical protein